MQKKWLSAMLIALIVGRFALAPELAFADETTAKDVEEETLQAIGTMVSVLLQTVSALLWPVLLVIGELMDSDLIIGPGMEDKLLSIWVQVRNLVNIGFVIVLLIIAIYNVLGIGGGEGNFAIKTALPKLVLGLILVNFTFLGGRVLLDVSNVATTAAFALPELVGKENYDFAKVRSEFEEKVCGGYIGVDIDSPDIPPFTTMICAVDQTGTDSTTGAALGTFTGNMNEWMSATYFTDLNVNNASLVMAVNMGALDQLGLLKPGAIKTWSDLVTNSIFSLVMYFIFAISYIVLALVLLARIVVLWVAMALSPLVVLFYVVPQLKESVGSNLDIMEKVTKHIMAPIIIGLTMSIGIIMMTAVDDFASLSDTTLDGLMSTKFMLSGSNDMENFIVAIVTVVIVWSGIFAAAEGTAASFATNFVKDFGERMGKSVAKAPLYLPTLPIGLKGDGTMEKISPAAIFGLANAASRNFQSDARMREQAQKAVDRSPLLQKLVGNEMGSPSGMSAAENARSAANKASDGIAYNSEAKQIAEHLYEAARQGSTLTGNAKTELEGKLQAAITSAANGRLTPLYDLLKDNTREQLGLQGITDGQFSVLKESVREGVKTPTSSAGSGGATPVAELPLSTLELSSLTEPQGAITVGEFETNSTDQGWLESQGLDADQVKDIRAEIAARSNPS